MNIWAWKRTKLNWSKAAGTLRYDPSGSEEACRLSWRLEPIRDMVGLPKSQCRLRKHLHLLSVEVNPRSKNCLVAEETVYQLLGICDRFRITLSRRIWTSQLSFFIRATGRPGKFQSIGKRDFQAFQVPTPSHHLSLPIR